MTKPDYIEMAHGGGGRLARSLIETEILPRFGGNVLNGLPDAATLPALSGAPVLTTDSYVVQPLEFPGGNIGDLAVHGTVNDLAAAGGRPLWLSLALILEEGLPLTVLRAVLDSVQRRAAECEIRVATGDIKVVGRGQCDGLYVNTSGLGEKLPGFDLGSARIREGDHVLVSGPLADHGAAVLAVRENIRIAGGPVSDTGPVHRLVEAAAGQAASVHFMRDPTRGGPAAVLNEAVEECGLDICLTESDLPFSAGTRAVCELLGMDPLHLASEGRLIAVCDGGAAEEILRIWRDRPEGSGAVRIGTVEAGPAPGSGGRVVLETVAGGRRLVDVPRGELLPRIC